MVETGVIWTMGRVLRVWLGYVEGEGCVNQVRVYDKLGASLAMGCYLGTPGKWIPVVGKWYMRWLWV